MFAKKQEQKEKKEQKELQEAQERQELLEERKGPLTVLIESNNEQDSWHKESQRAN